MTATKVLALDAADQANFTDAVLEAWKAKGVQFIALYVKWSTPKLVTMIFKHGLGILPICESTVTRALSGYSGGLADAKQFLAQMRPKLGFDALPKQVAVVWTDDEDTQAKDQAAVVDYGRGWKDGLAGANRTVVYGNGAICAACKASGYVDFEWVAGGSGMRGTTAERPKADMYQEVGDKENLGGGYDIDSDVEQNPDLSWIWWPAGDARALPFNGQTPPAPKPVTPPSPVKPDAVKELVVALQTALHDIIDANGVPLYNDTIDGDPGPNTQAALAKWRKL